MIKQGRGIQREMTIEREQQCIFQCDELWRVFVFVSFKFLLHKYMWCVLDLRFWLKKHKKMFALDTRLGNLLMESVSSTFHTS